MPSRCRALLLLATAPILAGDLRAGEIFQHSDAASSSQVFVLKQGSTLVRLAPGVGANVFSIEIDGIEYLRTPADMYRFSGLEHGTPVLYPTPNRVRDGRFRFDGRDFAFEPNFGPHRIHGLVIGQPWQLVAQETTDDSASIRCAIDFAPGAAWYEQFPLPHRLLLTVTVTEGAVRWDYEVDNQAGTAPVPYGFGLHPYFRYQGARAETFVTLPASHWMEAQDAFPTGRLVPAAELDYPLGEPISLGARSFDDVFWGVRPDQPTMIDFRDRHRGLEVTASPEFTHEVLWAEDFPVFSVEPQTSSTDAHNLHAAGFADAAHLQVCAAGETCGGWVELRFTAASSWSWLWDDPNFLLSQQHCESCHGIVFSGARAPDLWRGEWRFAQSPDDVARIIADGLPNADMPAFKGMLSEAQIVGLAGFMNLILNELPAKEMQTEQEVADTEPRQTFVATFALETVVEGLATPWSFAFLPDGSIILTEKAGELRLLQDGVLSEPVRGTPAVAYRQDAGLLALALHPDFAENGWIYLAFADPGEDPDTSTTRLVRGRIRDHNWVDQETIWRAPPELYRPDNSHFGTRLLFDGDFLYFSIGDRGRREDAQDLASPYGKIHRLRADGSLPADNPFVQTPGALASIWSYGHRNVQGLARAPDGALWASEHGPRGGDELNRIVAGGNYGWPLATWGLEFSGERISDAVSLPGMVDPELVWQEAIAPAAIDFYDGERFPAWRGSLMVTSLAAKELRRVEIQGDRVVGQEVLLSGVGRIRDVQVGPDGYPYIAVERRGNTGYILRLVPATRSERTLF